MMASRTESDNSMFAHGIKAMRIGLAVKKKSLIPIGSHMKLGHTLRMAQSKIGMAKVKLWM